MGNGIYRGRGDEMSNEIVIGEGFIHGIEVEWIAQDETVKKWYDIAEDGKLVFIPDEVENER